MIVRFDWLLNWFREWWRSLDACSGVEVVHASVDPDASGAPDLRLFASGVTQSIQPGIAPQTRALWIDSRARFGAQIKMYGAIGDASHQARKTCHVPRDANGRVLPALALDIHPVKLATVDPRVGDEIVAWVNTPSQRARYGVARIIWNRRKATEATDWKFVPYHGTSPHIDHVHVSVGGCMS